MMKKSFFFIILKKKWKFLFRILNLRPRRRFDRSKNRRWRKNKKKILKYWKTGKKLIVSTIDSTVSIQRICDPISNKLIIRALIVDEAHILFSEFPQWKFHKLSKSEWTIFVNFLFPVWKMQFFAKKNFNSVSKFFGAQIPVLDTSRWFICFKAC